MTRKRDIEKKEENTVEEVKEEKKEEKAKENAEIEEEEKSEASDLADDWEDSDEEVVKKETAPKEKKDVFLGEEEVVEETKVEATNAISNKKKKELRKKELAAKKKEDTKSIFEINRDQAKKATKNLPKALQLEIDSSDDFRCPIVAVLGHVDTGKTLLLDKIRSTNVQSGEAGGITQQIGATYFPYEALQRNLGRMANDELGKQILQIPGLLVIDTPGHESFSNLRSRGSSLCDLAVLVVDLMHGLEQQTLESIELLRQKNTPFIVALNKIDRIHEWKKEEFCPSQKAIRRQTKHAKNEFKSKMEKSFLQFAENSLNVALYWDNNDDDFYNVVPTSAMTGEGIPDLLGMIIKMTQGKLKDEISEQQTFECTVLEVKMIEGHGTTIDVVLVHGELKVGDTIVVAGFNGPISTKIRALLTPQPMKEMRVKGDYIHHESCKGAMGIKISAPELDWALAGGELYRAETEEDVEELEDLISENMLNFVEKYISKNDEGVYVQASTLGSLEALLEFLKQSKIPVNDVNIGPVNRKDVQKAMKWLVQEDQDNVKKEYATILAFDVKVAPEAKEFAEENGVKIMTANIIYHLFDEFTEYVEVCKNERKAAHTQDAVFPCIIEPIKDALFNNKNPILMGMRVLDGKIKVGTPLCVPDKGFLKIGRVTGIEKQKVAVTEARLKDGDVSVKIEGDSTIMVGRHFDENSRLCSVITKNSI